MKKLLRIAKWIGIIILAIILAPIILVFLILIMSARGINSIKYRISTKTGIQENDYVRLNGIEQFIRIRGEDIANPVIVFLHGGPGFSMGHIAHYFQTNLEDDYTIVHWDQRGCGRTYYKNNANFSVDELSAELLLDDLDTLVDYLRKKFGQKQVILMGHSWGTVLGTRYVLEHPEKVSEYIAIGYAVNGQEGNIISANKALDLAKKAKNTDDVNALQQAIASCSSADSLKTLDIKSFTIIMRIRSKYLTAKGEMSAMGQVWTGLSSPYTNIDDMKWFFTLANFERTCKLTAPLINYAIFNYDANALVYKFEVPVYIIQGEGDWTTPVAPVQEYYEKIKAPKKELILIPNAGHNPYLDYSEEFCKVVKEVLIK